jgi:hypothetical protein
MIEIINLHQWRRYDHVGRFGALFPQTSKQSFLFKSAKTPVPPPTNTLFLCQPTACSYANKHACSSDLQPTQLAALWKSDALWQLFQGTWEGRTFDRSSAALP